MIQSHIYLYDDDLRKVSKAAVRDICVTSKVGCKTILCEIQSLPKQFLCLYILNNVYRNYNASSAVYRIVNTTLTSSVIASKWCATANSNYSHRHIDTHSDTFIHIDTLIHITYTLMFSHFVNISRLMKSML